MRHPEDPAAPAPQLNQGGAPGQGTPGMAEEGDAPGEGVPGLGVFAGPKEGPLDEVARVSPQREGGGLCTIKWGFELGGRTTYWQEKFPMGWGMLIPKMEPHWYEERNRRGMQIVWRRMCRWPTTLFHTPKIANVAADNMKLITEFICNDGEVAWKREWPRPYHLAIFIPKGTSPGKMNFDEWINWIAPFPEMERKICAFGEAMRRLEMRCKFMLEVVGAYGSYEKHEQWRNVAEGMQVTIWGMREDDILRRWETMWTEELLWRACKARAMAGKD